MVIRLRLNDSAGRSEILGRGMTTVSWPTNLWQPSGKPQGVTDHVRGEAIPRLCGGSR